MKVNVEKFKYISNKLLVCTDDSYIIMLIMYIDKSILKNVKKNTDLLIPYVFRDKDFFSFLLVSYLGKKSDSGYICYYLPNFIENQTNFMPLILEIVKQNERFNRSQLVQGIYNYIIEYISYSKTNISHIINEDNLFFSKLQ